MLASRLKTALGLLCACPSFAFAADIDGATLSAPWSIPFVGLLLSIALMPLLAPMFWHHHYGKICLLYTSDAADDLLCVDLGGRRIIKKKIIDDTQIRNQ